MASQKEYTLPITRGPSAMEIVWCHYHPQPAERTPLIFELSYSDKSIIIGVFVTGSDELSIVDRAFSLRGVLSSYHRGHPAKRPTKADATFEIGNYSMVTRKGFITVSRYIVDLIEQGKSIIK